jgi:diguanylate cyclase (GGDEF)-like protein/PAS domain S-box-containing protein
LLEDPAVNGLVLNIRDISDRVAAAAARERLSAVVEATRDLVLVLDASGRVLDLNRAARQELAHGTVAVGQTVFKMLPESVARSVVETAIPAAVRNGSWEGEVQLHTAGEGDVTLEVEILAHQDGDGHVAFLSCLLRDVTERRRFEQQLSYLATHDSLTGLGNRRYFEEYVATELEEALAAGRQGALLIVDLDGLKTVNDDLGHLAGDELLRGTASIIRDMSPPEAICARVGGDEFAVLVPGAGSVAGMAVAERLRTALRAARFDYGAEELSTTVSIGVAVMPVHGTDPEVILANADLAMYEAKSNRDACRMFSPAAAHRSELSERRIWERRMRDALDSDGFVFMAQPVREIDGEVVMYELLLRMSMGDELIPPSMFLPIAERSGLVTQIDRYVVTHAIRLIEEAEAKGRRVSLAVNISGRSLGDPELPNLVERRLRESGIDPALLVLEVTETAAISGLERGRRFVEILCSLGVRVAIDDFGAGFSSFAYIKTLPVTHVKIDGAFIQNMVSDVEDQHIVRAMIDLAHGLGKGVVAECVENEATLQMLRMFGVDMVQGYYLGRPATVAEVIGVDVVRRAA